MNKRQKKANLLEEDDSGVEVYYREGEEEIEETKVLLRVRASSRCRHWPGKGSLWLPPKELGLGPPLPSP